MIGLAASQAVAKEVQICILAGQSNMVGHGKTKFGRAPGNTDKDAGKAVKEELSTSCMTDQVLKA